MGLTELFAHVAGLFAMDMVREKNKEKEARKAAEQAAAVQAQAPLVMPTEPLPPSEMRNLRAIVESAERACRALDDADICDGIGLRAEGARGGLVQVLREDLARFLVCLATCDGPMSRDEARCLNALMGRNLDAADWCSELDRLGGSPVTYTSRCPLSFMLMSIVADRDASAFIDMYDKLGCVVLKADGSICEAEMDTMKGYLAALRRWGANLEDFDYSQAWRL